MKVVKITGDNITMKPLNQNRMKANELRIGNLVIDGHDIEEVNYRMIKMLVEKEAEFDPIPLTEEWLLKVGAKELNAKRDVLKEFVLKTVRIEMSNSGNFYYKNSKLILESVHQLQNLYFALTGKELTFKSE